MDDTHLSRASDSAATRKRRSSILKSQRPPRTPFSELEFHVATPTDTAKSRRVSFSKRTGVAEFATNEATTTWKNFYEEHNKSLELSNDSGSKQPVGHLGKRIFDQQFEEVEADFIGIHNTGRNINVSSSLNNFEHQLAALECTDDIKLTAPQNKFELSAFTNNQTKLFDELAIPCGEVTDRIDFNFSAVQHIGGTDDLDEIQNDLKKNFGHGAFKKKNMSEYIEVDLNMTQVVKNDDDMSITDTVHSPKVRDVSKNGSVRVDLTDRIDINFSAIQQNGERDDLDEIQKDLQQKFGHAPFEKQNVSELIDLNMSRHVKNENDSHSLKVQDISKNCSGKHKDWIEDKENNPINRINPYAVLSETENFAINKEPDKVLVFDGKRLTIQSEKVDNENCRQTLLPDVPEKAPQRKTIVLNVNDDLPNFVDDSHTAHTSGFTDVAKLKKSMVIDDMSVTEPFEDIKKRTILYDDVLGNISLTQAVPANIVIPENKRRTVLYEEDTGNISITQAIPTNIITEKRRTIVYDNNDGNMSITQALPAIVVKENKTNIQQNDKRKTIVFDDGNMSMTQAIPANILPEKTTRRRTIVFEDNAGNLSITQAVPNILITEAKAEKRRTIVYEDETGNISVTQAIPSNILIAENSSDRRRTVVFESDTGNISVTQAVPSSLILQEKVNDINISETKTVPAQILTDNSRRRTIVYEDETGNLSITQAVPNHVIQGISTQNLISQDAKMPDCGFAKVESASNETNKRRTIVFDSDDADISVTQAVSLNQLIYAIRNEEKEKVLKTDAKENEPRTDVMTNHATNKRRTVVFDNDEADISMTEAVPMNVVHCFNQSVVSTDKVIHNSNPFNEGNKHRTVVFENDEADISTTLAVNTNQFRPELAQQNVHDDLEAALNEALHAKNGKSQRTIVYDKENVNISIAQTIQDRDVNSLISQSLRENVMENALKRRTIVFEDKNISMTESMPVNILANNTEIKNIDNSESKDPNVSEILDISMPHINAEQNDLLDPEIRDVPSTKLKHQAEIAANKSLNLDQKSVNFVTKPIPSNLLTTNKSENQENNKDINKVPIVSKAIGVSEVIIYQAALSKRTEQGDTKFQEPSIQNNEKLSSSSKTADANEVKDNNENISSSSKITDAIEVKEPTKSNKDDQESQMNDQNEITGHNQSEINDDLSQASSDSTSVMSKSILNDLLDMSSASMVAIDDKGLMAQVDEPTKKTDYEYLSTEEAKSCVENKSNDTLFFITKDDDEAQIQTDKIDNDGLQLTEHSPLPLEYIDEPAMVADLQNNLEDLKDALRDEKNKNRHYEKILSSDLDKSKVKELDKTKGSKSFKAANDTNELLEMLSELTDKTIVRELDAHLEEDEKQPEPLLIKGHLALENKSGSDPEPKRLSFATRRQSIVMSREDLLNNISMAGAALKSRIDFDDSDLENTVGESPEQEKSPQKSVRVSSEVVKTLHFDESISETSIHSERKMTPLKKTAFGETSYMQEHKGKVIPDYLKDVSDGIKELMDDLVKPNADVILPFDCLDKSTKKVASTCSTQIQANLITSSQVDLSSALYSNPDSAYDVNVNKISSADMINDAVNRSVSRALKSPIKSILSKSTTATHASEKSLDSKWDSTDAGVRTIIPSRLPESPGRVLIFDHNNPLNNILLAPETFTEVHRYNPGQSTETLCVSERSDSVQISLNEKDNGCETERVSTQYNVGSVIHSVKQSGDANSGKVAESQSKVSTLSKPMSVDRSTHVKISDVKHIQVNTLIAMKGNNELLEASSSLTLVDDALARSTFDVDIDTRTTTSQEEMAVSPMKVIYKIKGDGMLIEKQDSDLTSNDDLEDRMKPKKRVYSPTKGDKHMHCTLSSLDVTPKPTSKMQKLSESPDGFKTIDVSQSEMKPEMQSEPEMNTKKKSPRKTKAKKPGTSITVQQLMTEYNVGPIDHETLDEQIKGVLRDPKSDCSSIEPTQTVSQSDCASLDMVSSFTSSKNLRGDCSSVAVSSKSSKVSRMDWQQELVDQLSSKNLEVECESSANVVAKIDMLPFMGSHECEWESSGGDTWSFRLLHARLRLAVRLAHRHENATRTRVRADTPVRAVQLEILPHDSKNTLAVLCVSFAAETMRYFINRGCACAGDVPALVRRCAAAARLAARWGRVMCEAKLHLAYTISADSLLTLKVANIPLRSVWEVTMRLELVVEDAREAPWVRAGEVRVRRVLSAAAHAAPAPRVARALRHLPRDWSHAPRTVWRVFKYLKNKTRDDDELFMGQ